MRYVIAGALLCLSFAAAGATKTVTWVNPTQNTDGSSLPSSAITRTTVVWGTSATTLTNSKVVAGAATSTTVDLAPGTWFVGAKTTANGNDSGLSNVFQIVVPQPTPNPPTGLTVTESVAHEIRWDASKFAMVLGRRIGIARLGAACNEAKTIGDGWYAPYQSRAVKLTREPKFGVVVKCG